MKNKIMGSVVAGLLIACAGLANAAEPVALTDTQMDSVSAGNGGAPHVGPWQGWHHHRHHHHHRHFIVTPIGFRVITFVTIGRI